MKKIFTFLLVLSLLIPNNIKSQDDGAAAAAIAAGVLAIGSGIAAVEQLKEQMELKAVEQILSSYPEIKNFELKTSTLKGAKVKDISRTGIVTYEINNIGGERLVLFLERINPQGLISRLRQDGMTSPELQFAIVSTIRIEYEHNITQQIYVSSEAWTLAQASTEELISIINQIGSSQATDATGTDLSRSILEYYIGNNTPLPTQKAIAQLQDEVKLLF